MLISRLLCYALREHNGGRKSSGDLWWEGHMLLFWDLLYVNPDTSSPCVWLATVCSPCLHSACKQPAFSWTSWPLQSRYSPTLNSGNQHLSKHHNRSRPEAQSRGEFHSPGFAGAVSLTTISVNHRPDGVETISQTPSARRFIAAP